MNGSVSHKGGRVATTSRLNTNSVDMRLERRLMKHTLSLNKKIVIKTNTHRSDSDDDTDNDTKKQKKMFDFNLGTFCTFQISNAETLDKIVYALNKFHLKPFLSERKPVPLKFIKLISNPLVYDNVSLDDIEPIVFYLAGILKTSIDQIILHLKLDSPITLIFQKIYQVSPSNPYSNEKKLQFLERFFCIYQFGGGELISRLYDLVEGDESFFVIVISIIVCNSFSKIFTIPNFENFGESYMFQNYVHIDESIGFAKEVLHSLEDIKSEQMKNKQTAYIDRNFPVLDKSSKSLSLLNKELADSSVLKHLVNKSTDVNFKENFISNDIDGKIYDKNFNNPESIHNIGKENEEPEVRSKVAGASQFNANDQDDEYAYIKDIAGIVNDDSSRADDLLKGITTSDSVDKHLGKTNSDFSLENKAHTASSLPFSRVDGISDSPLMNNVPLPNHLQTSVPMNDSSLFLSQVGLSNSFTPRAQSPFVSNMSTHSLPLLQSNNLLNNAFGTNAFPSSELSSVDIRKPTSPDTTSPNLSDSSTMFSLTSKLATSATTGSQSSFWAAANKSVIGANATNSVWSHNQSTSSSKLWDTTSNTHNQQDSLNEIGKNNSQKVDPKTNFKISGFLDKEEQNSILHNKVPPMKKEAVAVEANNNDSPNRGVILLGDVPFVRAPFRKLSSTSNSSDDTFFDSFYDANEDPKSQLVGSSSDRPQNLFEVRSAVAKPPQTNKSQDSFRERTLLSTQQLSKDAKATNVVILPEKPTNVAALPNKPTNDIKKSEDLNSKDTINISQGKKKSEVKTISTDRKLPHKQSVESKTAVKKDEPAATSTLNDTSDIDTRATLPASSGYFSRFLENIIKDLHDDLRRFGGRKVTTPSILMEKALSSNIATQDDSKSKSLKVLKQGREKQREKEKEKSRLKQQQQTSKKDKLKGVVLSKDRVTVSLPVKSEPLLPKPLAPELIEEQKRKLIEERVKAAKEKQLLAEEKDQALADQKGRMPTDEEVKAKAETLQPSLKEISKSTNPTNIKDHDKMNHNKASIKESANNDHPSSADSDSSTKGTFAYSLKSGELLSLDVPANTSAPYSASKSTASSEFNDLYGSILADIDAVNHDTKVVGFDESDIIYDVVSDALDEDIMFFQDLNCDCTPFEELSPAESLHRKVDSALNAYRHDTYSSAQDNGDKTTKPDTSVHRETHIAQQDVDNKKSSMNTVVLNKKTDVVEKKTLEKNLDLRKAEEIQHPVLQFGPSEPTVTFEENNYLNDFDYFTNLRKSSKLSNLGVSGMSLKYDLVDLQGLEYELHQIQNQLGKTYRIFKEKNVEFVETENLLVSRYLPYTNELDEILEKKCKDYGDIYNKDLVNVEKTLTKSETFLYLDTPAQTESSKKKASKKKARKKEKLRAAALKPHEIINPFKGTGNTSGGIDITKSNSNSLESLDDYANENIELASDTKLDDKGQNDKVESTKPHESYDASDDEHPNNSIRTKSNGEVDQKYIEPTFKAEQPIETETAVVAGNSVEAELPVETKQPAEVEPPVVTEPPVEINQPAEVELIIDETINESTNSKNSDKVNENDTIREEFDENEILEELLYDNFEEEEKDMNFMSIVGFLQDLFPECPLSEIKARVRSSNDIDALVYNLFLEKDEEFNEDAYVNEVSSTPIINFPDNVYQLKEIFPDFDLDILNNVYHEHNEDMHITSEALLAGSVPTSFQEISLSKKKASNLLGEASEKNDELPKEEVPFSTQLSRLSMITGLSHQQVTPFLRKSKNNFIQALINIIKNNNDSFILGGQSSSIPKGGRVQRGGGNNNKRKGQSYNYDANSLEAQELKAIYLSNDEFKTMSETFFEKALCFFKGDYSKVIEIAMIIIEHEANDLTFGRHEKRKTTSSIVPSAATVLSSKIPSNGISGKTSTSLPYSTVVNSGSIHKPDNTQMQGQSASERYKKMSELLMSKISSTNHGGIAAYYKDVSKEARNKYRQSLVDEDYERMNERIEECRISGKLDLHRLSVQSAIQATKECLQDWWQEEINNRQLDGTFNKYGSKVLFVDPLVIVTGRGNHSVGGVAKIKVSVISYLHRANCVFEEQLGRVTVTGCKKR